MIVEPLMLMLVGFLTPLVGLEAKAQLQDDCACQTTPGLRARKNIDCLTPHELEVFKHAFDIVQKRSRNDSNDKTGYAYQVRIHGDRRVGPCEHGSELIWPWHRAQLFYFENLLRATDPDHPTLSTKDVTLAYWDWTKPPSGVHGFPKAYEDPTSPLFHEGRNQYDLTNPPPLVAPADIGLNLNQWYLFGGSTTGPGNLESRAHNDVHAGYVGGDMANPAISVRDPIFWAHHTNLDRMWDLWQQKYHQNPVQQTTTLRGWPATFVPAPIVSNFNDIRNQLGYEYCPHMNENRIELRLAAVPENAITKTISVEAMLPAKQFTEAQVRLYGVKTPTSVTYRTRVFIHPANVACKPDDPAFVKTYLANSFTLWMMGHDDAPDANDMKGTHPATQDICLDVSPKIRELKANGLAPNQPLMVSMDFTELSAKLKTTKLVYGQSVVEFKKAFLELDPASPVAAPAKLAH